MNTLFSRWTLLFIMLLDGIGVGIVYPTLAYYFLENAPTLFMNHSNEESRLFFLGLIFAVYPFFMAIGSLKMGQLSDRIGRKKTLLLCLWGFSIGFLITSIGVYMSSYILLLFGRAVAGITAGCHVIAQASIADISSGHEKTKNISTIAMVNMLGFVIGPGLGGVLSSPEIFFMFNTATPFIVVMLMGLLALILTQVFFQETLKITSEDIPENLHTNDLQLLKNNFILQLALVYFLFTIGWNLFFQFAPVYLEKFFHVNAAMTGSFMSFIALIFMGSIGLVVRPILSQLSLLKGLFLGLILLLISILLMLQISSLALFSIAVIPLCIGGGFVYTCSLSLFSNAGDQMHQGHIMGVASAVKSLAWTLAPIISGIIAYFNVHWPMVGASICFALALILCFFLRKREGTF